MGELVGGVTRSVKGAAVSHTGAFQKVEGVLLLLEEEAVIDALNLDVEEVVDRAYVLDGELSIDGADDAM